MDKTVLAEIIAKHHKWLLGENGGERADLRSADLSSANLSYANLSYANLSSADLRSANLRSANLRSADLRSADLRSANLSSANLRSADLRSANLRSANLSSANLRSADLSSADLRSANLSYANLSYANLSSANLRSANLLETIVPVTSIVPDTGSFIGWKKLKGEVIAKLEIPEDAKRVSSFVGRKCRAEFVRVVELIGAEVGISNHDGKTEYKVGEIVRPDQFDDDLRIECTHGIHFFITRKEAEEY